VVGKILISFALSNFDYLRSRMNIVIEYIKYKLKAQGRHGTHSPFVYDFVDVCLTQKVPQEVIKEFRRYYQLLRNSDVVLDITDLGAGSKKLTQKRTVAKMAKISGSHGKYGELLFKLAHHYQPLHILELGTSLGLGTWMLSKGCPKAKITTVEGCPNTFRFVSKQLVQLSNVSCVNSSFVDFLGSNHTCYDIIYIDGDHRGEKVQEMLELLAPTLHDESIIVIDDIRWSRDMFDYWQQFKDMKRYHLTMDLFRIGIVMKRTHQQKEHFIIKY